MQAEALSWDDGAMPDTEADERWHVELGPNDVKVVSLEQLDDLYRLSLVDAETKVWQAGMRDWQPLRVIADLDEQPPPPKRTYPKPPSPSVAPPPPRRGPARAAASFYPELSLPPRAPVAVPLAPLPALAPLPMYGSESVRPLVVSRAPRPAARSGFGGLLIGLALIGGLGVTLYRNGLLDDGARAVHQEALYGRLEAALGGPSFGTPRAVAAAPQVVIEAPASHATAAPSVVAPKSAALITTHEEDISGARTKSAEPPVVSLESLGTERAKANTPLLVDAAKAASGARSALAPSKLAKRAEPPVAKAALLAKPLAVAKADAPSRASLAKAPPATEKSDAALSERERLNAAIGRSMSAASPAAAKKGGGSRAASEYDPLNPKL